MKTKIFFVIAIVFSCVSVHAADGMRPITSLDGSVGALGDRQLLVYKSVDYRFDSNARLFVATRLSDEALNENESRIVVEALNRIVARGWTPAVIQSIARYLVPFCNETMPILELAYHLLGGTDDGFDRLLLSAPIRGRVVHTGPLSSSFSRHMRGG